MPQQEERYFRVSVGREHRERLLRLPREAAARLEAHLATVARLAEEVDAADPIWAQLRDPLSGHLRYAMKGAFVLFEVDWERRSIVVHEVGTPSAWR